jgi:hypothetical protein
MFHLRHIELLLPLPPQQSLYQPSQFTDSTKLRSRTSLGGRVTLGSSEAQGIVEIRGLRTDILDLHIEIIVIHQPYQAVVSGNV